MNKTVLLSRIKGIVCYSYNIDSTQYKINSIYHKKASKLNLCSRLKMHVLMVSALAFAFKIVRPIIFSAVKN